MHVGITNPRWRRKRSRHSRCMRNPQFCVSGKMPVVSVTVVRCRRLVTSLLVGYDLDIYVVHEHWPGDDIPHIGWNALLIMSNHINMHVTCSTYKNTLFLKQSKLCKYKSVIAYIPRIKEQEHINTALIMPLAPVHSFHNGSPWRIMVVIKGGRVIVTHNQLW